MQPSRGRLLQQHRPCSSRYRVQNMNAKEQAAECRRCERSWSHIDTGHDAHIPAAAFAGLPPLQKLQASLRWLPLQQSAAAESKLLLSASILEVNSMATHGHALIVCSQACFYDRGTCSSTTTKDAPEGC